MRHFVSVLQTIFLIATRVSELVFSWLFSPLCLWALMELSRAFYVYSLRHQIMVI
jgi:hypothetical protein